MIVPVTDIERATDFYAAALGLPVRSVTPTWTLLGEDGEALALEAAPVAGVDLGIGIKVADLQATLTAIAAKGGSVHSHDEPVARVADPDGNILRMPIRGSTS